MATEKSKVILDYLRVRSGVGRKGGRERKKERKEEGWMGGGKQVDRQAGKKVYLHNRTQTVHYIKADLQ